MSRNESVGWYRDARFGLFLHWGLYSVAGRNEWGIYLDRMPLAEYARYAGRFRAERYDPRRWADMAAASGIKYAVLTTRHHDGYCLFETATTDFCAPKTGPGRDLIAPYAEAMREAGIRVGFYYSISDWRRKGFWDPKRYPESAAAMVENTHAQLRELMTNYGKVDLFWHDGAIWHDETPAVEAYRCVELNAMIRKLQPGIFLSNNAGVAEDFATMENQIVPPRNVDQMWESCMEMDCITWGNTRHSPNLRTAEQLVADLVEVSAGAGNLLLNTGPMPDGNIAPEEERRIRVAGAWMKRHGECLYGSRRSPLEEMGVMGSANRHARWIGTDDPCVHYLALLCWTGTEFFTVLVDGEVVDVTLVDTGRQVAFTRGPSGRLTFTGLPETPPDALSTMFRIRFKKPPHLMEATTDGAWLQSDI